MKQKRLLERRTFLKALGLGLCAPLAMRIARYASAAPSPRQSRFLSLFIPHGMPCEHFDPGSAGALDLGALPGEGILRPFMPYQAQMNVLRGIEYVGYSNHPTISAVFTNAAGASVEHVIAHKLGLTPTILGAVPWRVNDFGPDSQLFHDGTDWVRPELNPVKAASSLLSGIGGDDTGTGTDTGPNEVDFRNAMLDLSISEVESLRKEVRSLTREDTKLSKHLESLQALKESGDDTDDMNTGQGCSSKPSTPALDRVAAASDNGNNGAYFLDTANFGDIFEAQLEVAAYSLLCGSTRIVGIQTMYVNALINFGFMGVTQDHHDPLSHSIDPANRGEFAKAQRWLLERFEEKVLRVLSQPDPDDPEHTVLDNTLIYVTSEIADGNEHNCNKQPIWVGGKEFTTFVPAFTLGGAAGAIKSGQILDFDNRSHADVLMSLCGLMGVSVDSFGANSGGAIAELNA
jgi:hypothetical protein